MKNGILIFASLFAFTSAGFAQQVNGEILLNQRSRNSIELKTPEAVGLYAQLREKEMAVNFIFKGSGLAKTKSGNDVALIWFRTTVKHNGKEIGSMKRSPMPFFPGDMLMPVETFDIISILVSGKNQPNERLLPGKYEVIFEAAPVNAKGEIKPASLTFEVR